MWILRMNMADRSFRLEDSPTKYRTLGGRGLSSTIVHEEVHPLCHPLGPNNKLVFAPGIVTGTNASTSARVSVGGKSPLTGTIKESIASDHYAAHAVAAAITSALSGKVNCSLGLSRMLSMLKFMHDRNPIWKR